MASLGMDFEVRAYQSGRWTDPETPAEARRGSGAFSQAGRRRDTTTRDVSFWRSTLELLASETRALKAEGLVVIETGFEPWDMRRDQKGPLARVCESHPGVIVSFASRLVGPLRYATDAYAPRYSGDPPGWQANIRAVALTLGALRSIDRWGVARSGQQYTGWKALPATTGVTFPSADEALRWMREHKPRGSTAQAPRELYRELARTWHAEGSAPDALQWERLQAARLLLHDAAMM